MAASLLLGVSAAPLPPAASPGSPSQILVLGMHHSGTSLVSNLTMMMGAFGGKTEDMLLHPENPLKFWERRDVVALDERRVAAGVQKAAERYEIPAWVAYGFDESASAERVHESGEARAIVSQLNEQRPWVTKDPRMSLVANEWIELLDAPACVIVHRQPLHVANSMMIYSHNVSFAEWGSVYEAYYSRAMKACANLPTVVVQHEEITANPYAAVKKLHEGLVAAGVQGLTLPAEERIAKLLRPAAPKEVKFLASERKMIGQRRRHLRGAHRRHGGHRRGVQGDRVQGGPRVPVAHRASQVAGGVRDDPHDQERRLLPRRPRPRLLHPLL